MASGAFYLTSASLAILTPSVMDDDYEESSSLLWHKISIGIHAPAMFFAMISGIQAERDLEKGKEKSTLAQWHKPASMIAFLGMSASFVIKF